MPELVARDQGQGASKAPMHFERDGSLENRFFAREALPQAPLQFRVAGLPEPVANVHPFPIDIARTEPKPRLGALGRHAINAPAFLLLFGLARIKNHTVTSL